MTHSLWTFDLADAAATERFGEQLVLFLAAGDLVALAGELGAGKTTLARAAVRGYVDDHSTDVPSPTYTLVQGYEGRRGEITHVDLFRLNAPEQLVELGLADALAAGPVLVEWPDRLDAAMADQALWLEITDHGKAGRRRIEIQGGGNWPRRIERIRAVGEFIEAAGWGKASRRFLPVDASARRYERLSEDRRAAVLMDMPRFAATGDERTYRARVHLADDVTPFVAVAKTLSALGLSAPEIYHADTETSLALIEDMGDQVFVDMIASGEDITEPYRAAVDVLVRLSDPVEGAGSTPPARFDAAAMACEIDLLPQWYWPLVTGAPVNAEISTGFETVWAPLLAGLGGGAEVLTLRDYHSPNLMWLPERSGIARVGLLDFQDAVMAHPAYDLVSLLQDARIDLPKRLERDMYDYYIERARARSASFDEAAFSAAYAALGAQRNTKILGIFARLALRDGKRRYLAHLDRVRGYLRQNLAHPSLDALRLWYEEHGVLDDSKIPGEQNL